MKKSLVTLGLMAIVNLFAIGTANAALLLDQSPDSTLGVLSFDATNIDTRQTFATRLTLAEPTQITGMSVFSNHHGGLGNPVVFKIFEDVSSMPASASGADRPIPRC